MYTGHHPGAEFCTIARPLSFHHINHGTTSHTLTLQELVACVHGQWQHQTQTQMKGGWAKIPSLPLWSVGAVAVNHLVNEEVKRGRTKAVHAATYPHRTQDANNDWRVVADI